MPLSSSYPSTKDLLKRISDCQILLNEIHDTLGHTQAYGLAVPPTTVQTWRIIIDRLDCLSYRWEIALQKKKSHPFNILCSPKCEATVTKLWKALERALDHSIRAADDEDNGKKNAAERRRRLERFGARYNSDSGKAPDVEAYRALGSLQRYTEGRGWTTKDDFGAIWSESEMQQRKEISEKHIRDVNHRLYSQHMWGNVHATGFNYHGDEWCLSMREKAFSKQLKED